MGFVNMDNVNVFYITAIKRIYIVEFSSNLRTGDNRIIISGKIINEPRRYTPFAYRSDIL